jgi:ABC-type branched-subunit amino acid transport system ATPase component
MPMSVDGFACDSVVCGYGKKMILRGVTLNVASGEIVAMIGHNGAGKSTLLKAMFGLLPLWGGQVVLDGCAMPKPSPRALLRAGVAYVPQGNRVFPALTVKENLEAAGAILGDRQQAAAGLERVAGLFPALANRLRQRAGTLSGGEKQELALARALLLSPRVLLLDEPTLGLASPLVRQTLERIQELSRTSRFAALIVEQRVREVLNVTQRVYVLRDGSVSFSGPSAALSGSERLREVYF